MKIFRYLLIASTIVFLSACEQAESPAGEAADMAETGSESMTAPAGTDRNAPVAQGDAMQSGKGSFTGEVVETVDAAGYTYALLQTGEDEVWVAGPRVNIKAGDQVMATEGMSMGDYHSDSLDRTFKNLYFVTAIRPASSAAPMPQMPSNHPKTTDTIEVSESEIGDRQGAMSIIEVFNKRQDLAGESVTVKGKVVKYNPGIMGRNWIHLQDGTGEATSGNNDLTVTTNDSVRVGEVVIVSGNVILDKDFGAGYNYDVILEEASVVSN